MAAFNIVQNEWTVITKYKMIIPSPNLKKPLNRFKGLYGLKVKQVMVSGLIVKHTVSPTTTIFTCNYII